MGCDSVKSYVANADGELVAGKKKLESIILGGSSIPDEPNVQLRGTIPKKTQLRDHYSKDGLQTDLLQIGRWGVQRTVADSGSPATKPSKLRIWKIEP